MYSDDSSYVQFPATSDLGHVPLDGTTVNPVDLSFAHPSHEPTQSYGVSHNVVSAGHNFVGYQAVDHTSQGPPAWLCQSTGHTLGQGSVINGVPAGHFTGHPTLVGRMPRGHAICQWIVSGDLTLCGQIVTERTVSKHLAEHGIRDMHRNRVVWCGWLGCETVHIKRQSVTRHFREVHLGLKRKSPKHAIRRDTVLH